MSLLSPTTPGSEKGSEGTALIYCYIIVYIIRISGCNSPSAFYVLRSPLSHSAHVLYSSSIPRYPLYTYNQLAQVLVWI
jgi:hypothetical protein